jgi:hypothetical protein
MFAPLIEGIGRLLDRVAGNKRVISHVTGDYGCDIHDIVPSIKLGPGDTVRIHSERILFEIRYSRLTFLNHHRVMFKVSGQATGDIAKRLPAEFFEGAYFPNLSNPFLKWTKYPHVYAIHAFVDDIRLS